MRGLAVRLTARLNTQKPSQKPNERLDRGHKEQKTEKSTRKRQKKKAKPSKLLLARFFVDKKRESSEHSDGRRLLPHLRPLKKPRVCENPQKEKYDAQKRP